MNPAAPWWLPPDGLGDLDGWLAAMREVEALCPVEGPPVPLYAVEVDNDGDEWARYLLDLERARERIRTVGYYIPTEPIDRTT